MKSRLQRRLTEVEAAARKRSPELLGSIEEHHIGAWPPKSENAKGIQQCTEHPNCAVRITPIMAPIRRVILLEASEVPPPN